MRRVFSTIVCVFFLSLSVVAENGLMYGQRNIKYVSTKYFDIIYGASSEQSAAELAAQSDAVYESICHDMGLPLETALCSRSRMPVVISSATDVFNAYYTNYTYNHIVLYDAVPEDEMAVNDETIVDTFKHELTHAITINMRNGFWRAVDTVIGDVANWGDYIVMPSLIKEGAAVAYESKDGTGRLNDEYYLQTVKQAKIENKFPSWSDVTGAMDMYPFGSSAYAFGGPFTQWLQKTYGMEKYAEYWYRAVNMKSLTFATSFKKVFGISITSAWNNFKESVVVPAVDANPLAVDGITDFFTFANPEVSKEISLQNRSASLYTNLTESNRGIAFLDEQMGSVCYAEKKSDGTFSSAHTLFGMKNVSRVSLSSDGVFLAVSYYDINHMNVKNSVLIYNMETNNSYTLAETGLRDATIVLKDGRYFLVAVKTVSQNASLEVYKLSVSGGVKRSVKDAVLVQTVYFPRGDIASSLSDGGDGTIVCSYKTGMTWSVRFFANIGVADATVSATVFALPKEDMRIRSVSLVSTDEEDATYAFSWTAPGTMPRLGYLVLHNKSDDSQKSAASFMLMQSDVSGGVYFPVAYRCADSNRGQLPSVAYVGSFYQDEKLFVMNSAKILFEEISASPNTQTVETTAPSLSFDKSVLATAKPYKKVYGPRGMLMPWSEIPQYSSSFSKPSTISFPGLTWTTSVPWDSDTFALSAGYDYFSGAEGLLTLFTGGSQTSLFKYSVQTQATADVEGFKQFVNYGVVQSGVLIGKETSFIVNEQNIVLLGRQQTAVPSTFSNKSFSDLYCSEATTDQTNYCLALNQVAFQISNVHQTGKERYEKFGATMLAAYQIAYLGKLGDSFSTENVYQNIYPTLTMHVPSLIPITCTYGMTYNFPVAATISLYPNYKEFLSGEAEMVLFSKEIQRGLSYVPVFFNRYTFTAAYLIDVYNRNDTFAITGFFSDCQKMGSMDFEDCIEAKLIFDVTANTGGFASSGLFTHLGVAFMYYPHSDGKYSVTFTNALLF